MIILTTECERDPELILEIERYTHALSRMNIALAKALSDPEKSKELGLVIEKLALCNFNELTPEDKELINRYR